MSQRGWRPFLSGPGLAMSLAGFLALSCTGCGRGEPEPVDDLSRLTIKLRSPAFADGEMIPREFTCDGADRSPPLEWSGVPQATAELALICDDPDAPTGTFTHWVVVHLPGWVEGLKEGVPAAGEVPRESIVATNDKGKIYIQQGKNDFGKIGYGGPCPPGGTHRYVFRLYALDAPPIQGETPWTRSEVLTAIKGHILAEGRLTGKYARSK